MAKRASCVTLDWFQVAALGTDTFKHKPAWSMYEGLVSI